MPVCPGQHAVHLVENDHLRPGRAQQRAADIFLAGQCAPGHCRRAHTGQQFAVEVPFERLGRHLSNHHWTTINTGHLTELWRVSALELADNLGLSHARVAIDQQTGHPVTGWVGQQVFQARERQASLIEADPAVGPDPGDTLIIRERRELPIRRIEMRALPCPAHDHSSTSNVGTMSPCPP